MIPQILCNKIMDLEPAMAIEILSKNLGYEEEQANREYRQWRKSFLNKYSREVVVRRNTSKREVINQKKVLDMYFNKKMSAEAVAREMNVTGATIRNYIKRWGYELEERKYGGRAKK